MTTSLQHRFSRVQSVRLHWRRPDVLPKRGPRRVETPDGCLYLLVQLRECDDGDQPIRIGIYAPQSTDTNYEDGLYVDRADMAWSEVAAWAYLPELANYEHWGEVADMPELHP